MAKQNVLFLISRFLDGGIDTVLVEYLRALPPEQYNVTLAIGLDMGDLELHMPKIPHWVHVVHLIDEPGLLRVRQKKIRQKVSLASRAYDALALAPRRRLKMERRLERLALEADIIIDFDATFYTLLNRIGRRCQLPPIVGVYHFSIAANMARNRRHTMRQMKGMANYSSIALLCDAMVEEGRELFPGLSAKFRRIYNGYNLDELRRRASHGAFTMPERSYFLSVARLEESQKDFTTLLRGYALFKQRWLEMGQSEATLPALRLIGEGRSRGELEQLAASLSLQDDVVFMGFLADPSPWMLHAMAFILSSTYEGLPIVLIEAQTLGVPTIATDCPVGPKEVLKGIATDPLPQGDAGLLTEIRNPESMAEALMQVAASEALRERLSAAARAASERFDVRIALEGLLQRPAESRRPRISVVLNTFNAEKYLPQALESAQRFDEIVVVDMHSTDATRRIAEAYGARVILTECAGYCEPARNLAIQSATNPWVMVLDADEVIPASLRRYLYAVAAEKDAPAGVRIPRINQFMGRQMHSLYPDYILRFARRDSIYWPPTIHSTPEINGRIDTIPKHRRDLAIVHLEENTIPSRLEKIERYTDREVIRRGARRYSRLQRMAKPAFRFLHSYLLKGGFRDGWAGLQWARLDAIYKLRTIEKQHKAAQS